MPDLDALYRAHDRLMRALLTWPTPDEIYHYTSPASLRRIQETGAILPQEEVRGTQPWICWFSVNAFEWKALGTGGRPTYGILAYTLAEGRWQ